MLPAHCPIVLPIEQSRSSRVVLKDYADPKLAEAAKRRRKLMTKTEMMVMMLMVVMMVLILMAK